MAIAIVALGRVSDAEQEILAECSEWHDDAHDRYRTEQVRLRKLHEGSRPAKAGLANVARHLGGWAVVPGDLALPGRVIFARPPRRPRETEATTMEQDADLAQVERDIEVIWDVAQRMGLDPFPTHFEIVPATIMYEFGAYGLPGRFSHWTHGKAYYRMKTQYDYGLSKIYELVINTNPCYAFLMEANTPVQNKLVIAHVLGHCDFFRHNAYFGKTNRQMIETVSTNADRIRQYEFEHGQREVEAFLDAVLAIQEHVDHTSICCRGRRCHPSPA